MSSLQFVGEGNFGKVYKAEAEGIIKGQARTTVAVKTLQGDSPELAAVSPASVCLPLCDPSVRIGCCRCCQNRARTSQLGPLLVTLTLRTLRHPAAAALSRPRRVE